MTFHQRSALACSLPLAVAALALTVTAQSPATYVRDEHVLTLEDAVRKMSGLPAQILGLSDRGQVHAGFAADIAVFDPATVGETNSFEKTKSYAKGVQYVLVNGTLVVDKGEHTGARPGKALRGPGLKSATATTNDAAR